MAMIPRIVAQRGLEPGGVVQYPTSDPVGQALEQSGNKASALVQHYQDRVYQQERFQSLLDFDEFGAKLQTETESAKQTMQPGAMGLHDKLVETYDQKSQEWLSQIPESQRPEFAARIKAKRETFSLGAARLEKDESDRFQIDGIGKRLEVGKKGVIQDPASVPAFQSDIAEMVKASTLDPVAKQKLLDSIPKELTTTAFKGLAERDPEAAQRVAKGWGVDKGFSGSALDRTMQLLRDKEGFRANTYWDVNAERVGYGSDTITAADGSVRKVVRGDTVTRDDAERDLRRRSGEFLSGVQASVGQEAFSRLNPNQQAALGSVAYNYGSLPGTVVAAVKAGDAEGIAQSIEGLQGHNNGINRERRLSEAALARSRGADGPVAGVYAADPRFDAIPADVRPQLAAMADQEYKRKAATIAATETQAYTDKLNSLQTDIIDNKATMADVQKARQDGWLKDANDIMRVQQQIATRDKGLADVANFGKAMADPGYVWNPVDKEHKDMADAGFVALGGNMPALQTIAEKTGIVPKSAAVAMQGAMFSPDPKRVESALQTAANLVGGKYPDIFAGAENGAKLTEAGLTFREYVYGRGMSAADATKRIMEERTPEYEQKVKARIKKEDLDQVVKKELTIGQVESAFDDSFLGWRPNPDVGFDPTMRQRALGDYEASFRDNFMRNGDVSLSKTLALDEMKKTWGVTTLNGSKAVMKFPPERAPAYSGIENPADMVASQAIAAIKELNGVDVERKNLRIDEVKTTGERFMKGLPPTYVLSFTDKNGHVQTIPKQFYADPAAMRADQTAKRESGARQIMDRQSSYDQELAVQNSVLN